MFIFIQGFIFNFIIIKVAPVIFNTGFNKLKCSGIFAIFALLQFAIQILFREKTLHVDIAISLAMGFIGLIASMLFTWILKSQLKNKRSARHQTSN